MIFLWFCNTASDNSINFRFLSLNFCFLLALFFMRFCQFFIHVWVRLAVCWCAEKIAQLMAIKADWKLKTENCELETADCKLQTRIGPSKSSWNAEMLKCVPKLHLSLVEFLFHLQFTFCWFPLARLTPFFS